LSESTIKKGQRERRTVEITRMSFLLGLCTFSSDVREPLVGTGHAHIQHTTSSPSLDQSPTQNEYWPWKLLIHAIPTTRNSSKSETKKFK
jgi:hypothetical protein